MIVKISPHKFELRSRHTGRVLGTHPSRARALAQEAAIKASQSRAARGVRRNPSKGFHELQDAWRRASEARQELQITLERKYQETKWASKGEKSKLEKLDRAVDRASDAFYKWLEKNSSWDFSSGVNIAWLRDKLTEQQALSSEPPTLPAAATSYGYEAKEFHPMRRRNPWGEGRNSGPMLRPPLTAAEERRLEAETLRLMETSPYESADEEMEEYRRQKSRRVRRSRRNPSYAHPAMREPGETATQQAVRNYTIPVIIGVGLLGVLWYVNRTPSQSAYVLQTRPIPFEPSDAQKNAILQIAQSQLKSLGYNISRIDGISGPETQAAMTSFINANRDAVTRAGITYGQDQRAVLLALDDAYRSHFNLPAA